MLAGVLILLVTSGLVLVRTEGGQPDTTEPVEHPLPVWLRLTIVSASLLAFFAVSLIATRSV